MSYQTTHQRRASPAQLTASLQRRGLSPLGAQQALQGHVVSDPNDRAAIAQILAASVGSSDPSDIPVVPNAMTLGFSNVLVGSASPTYHKPIVARYRLD